MTINWNNITVRDASPDVPDFNLEFECHDGWDSATPKPKPLTWEETEGEDGDIYLDDSGEFDYNGDDGPTEDDLDSIERGEVVWID